MDTYDDYLEKDLSIFKEQVNRKIKAWISQLDSINLDTILEQLELSTQGPLFIRGDRLFRRLCGDYSAADFMQTVDDEETAHARRDDLCLTFINSKAIPAELRDEFIATYLEEMEEIEGEDIAEGAAGQYVTSSSPKGQGLDDMSLTTLTDTLPILTTSQARGIPVVPLSEALQVNAFARAFNPSTLLGPFDFPPRTTTQSVSRAPITANNTVTAAHKTSDASAANKTTNVTNTTNTKSNSIPLTNNYNYQAAYAASNGTTPSSQAEPATSTTKTSLSSAYMNIGKERLVWLRLPNGLPQQMPEPTATEMKRALMAERDLTYALDAAKQECAQVKLMSQEMLQLRQELRRSQEEGARKEMQIRELTSIAEDLRTQMQRLVTYSEHAQVTEAATQAKAVKSVRIQDTYELIEPSYDNIEDLSLLRANRQDTNKPLFSSTTRHLTTVQAQTAPQMTPAIQSTASTASHTYIPVNTPASVATHQVPPTTTMPSCPAPLSNPVVAGWGRGAAATQAEVAQGVHAKAAMQAPTGMNQTAFPHGSSQCYTDASRSSFNSRHVGKTVREWKIHFSGDSSVSREEFLEQVEENQRVDRLTEGELLDSLTPLFKKPALLWYRMLRPSLHTYREFKTAAINAYSKSKRNRTTLVVEAHRRTQGRGEPVSDYIAALYTIMNRFERPWSELEQIDLAIRNALPQIRKRLRQQKDNIQSFPQLLLLAQQAEDEESEDNYMEPPPADECFLPEAAWKPSPVKPKNMEAKPVLALVTEQSPPLTEAHVNKCIQEFFEKKFREVSNGKVQPTWPSSDPKNNSTNDNSSNQVPSFQGSSRGRGGRGGSTRGRGGLWQRGLRTSEIKPKSDKNKDKQPGPAEGKLTCWGCSWPGYTRATCPECSA